MGESSWPAILPEDTWRAVVALLANPSRRKSTSNRARWLLSGIARCGTCGEPMKSATVAKNRARGTTRTVYRCPTPGTGHVARSAEDLDAYVAEIVVGVLAKPGNAAAFAGSKDVDGEALAVEAVTIRQQQGEAAELFAEGKITGAQLASITGRLSERLAEVEAAMGRGVRSGALDAFAGGDPRAVWVGLSVDARRAVVRELVDVTVLSSGRRGNGFDPELVRLDWR
jgi:hypothetical protein